MNDWTPGLAEPRRPALSRHRRRDRRRHRSRAARARRSPAAAARTRQPAWARFHHGRARLCRGRQARPDGVASSDAAPSFAGATAMVRGEAAPRRSRADFSMNMPPEPDDPALLARMREGLQERRATISTRCCAIRVSAARRPTGRRLGLARAPRAGARRRSASSSRRARTARWSASSACSPKPARRSSARRSPIPACARSRRSSASISSASRRTRRRHARGARRGHARAHAPKAIYLNPTLQNPTTITIPERRRAAICATRAPARSADRRGRRLRLHPDPRARARSPRSRPTSAGISPGSPNASAPGCGSPMWSRPTRARAGRSTRRCARSA